MQRFVVSQVKSICDCQSVELRGLSGVGRGMERGRTHVHAAHWAVAVVHASVIHTAVVHVDLCLQKRCRRLLEFEKTLRKYSHV